MKINSKLLLLFLFLACSSPLLAVDLYTSSTGSDSANTCRNSSSPCNLSNGIASELAQVVGGRGDVLWMCAGACDGSGSATVAATIDANQYTIPSGTSFSNALTVQPFSGEIITFRPSGCESVMNIVWSVAYTIWKDFTIDGSNCLSAYGGYDSAGNFLGGAASDGISVGYASNHNRFQNIEVKNMGGNGIIVSNTHGDSQYNEFININSHHNARSAYGHGIYVGASHTLIDGGEYHDNTGSLLRNFGVQVYISNGGVDSNVIKNTKIYGNAKGMVIGSGSGNVVYNNLIYDNTEEGVEISYGQSGTKFFNNVVFGTTQNYAVEVGSGNAPEIRNNIFWGNANNGIKGTAVASNNLSINPLFVNQSAKDFRLQVVSPGIKAGVAVSEVQFDIMGTPRLGAPDIGAFQYMSSLTEMPPPPSNLRIK